MHLPRLRLLAQPILQSALAAATVGAAALFLGKRAESKLGRVPVETSRARNERRR